MSNRFLTCCLGPIKEKYEWVSENLPVLITTFHYCIEDRKVIPKLSPFASWPGTMINPISKTCLYNVDPIKPHFNIVKLGFTGVYIIFLISAQKNIDCGTR